MYIPHTADDIQEMLQRIGQKSVEDLFQSVPETLRLSRLLDLPDPLSEEGLRRAFAALSKKNTDDGRWVHFVGAGAYDHFIPSPVWHLLQRSEFYSAYTPYQPEISQGTLQAIFEFQTLICQLTGMDVANASMYDGASSAAEAVLMAARVTGKKRVLVAESVHPEYRDVMETYCRHSPVRLELLDAGPGGVTAVPASVSEPLEDVACLVVQSPNYFGCVEPVERLKERFLAKGGLLVQVVAEPLSLGILSPPGALGADVAVGECQSMGIPLQYGGPYAGFFATRKANMRNMPGRVVGETVDARGRRGYVLTLATREQHIRREKATSNICTNHNLCALAATLYLALIGKSGLRDIACLNLSKAEYAKKKFAGIQGVRLPHTAPTFNEFVVQLPVPAERVLEEVRREDRIVAGLSLAEPFPRWENGILVCVTERRTRQDIDRLAEAIEKRCRRT
jgi:glycine dehydrogenase subunit 1